MNHFKARLTYTAFVIATLFFSSNSLAKEELGFTTDDLGSSLYMISGVGGFTGGNIGLSVGDDAVVLIDNGVPSVSDLLKAEIAKITDRPVDYLINTHYHGDHTGNNKLFKETGSKIISHHNLREALVADEKRNVGDLPVITFSEELTLHINDLDIEIIHLPAAHTSGDSVVFFKQENVIHAGDLLFNGRFPYIDAKGGGSLQGVIAALSAINSMSDESTRIIAGHGPMATKSDIEGTIAMLKDAGGIVAALVEEGLTHQQIKAADPLAAYAEYNWGFITTERMIDQLILAARGEE